MQSSKPLNRIFVLDDSSSQHYTNLQDAMDNAMDNGMINGEECEIATYELVSVQKYKVALVPVIKLVPKQKVKKQPVPAARKRKINLD